MDQITDHHRAFEQEALQGRRTRGGEDAIGGRDDLSALPIHQCDRQSWGKALQLGGEIPAQIRADQGYGKVQVRPDGETAHGGLDEGCRQTLHLSATATR